MITWHQQRGIERALGLHRWVDNSCLHCGTSFDEDMTEDDRSYIPMTCGPNDARLYDEYRDENYLPHHWIISMHGIECAYCGFWIVGNTDPQDVHETSCDY